MKNKHLSDIDQLKDVDALGRKNECPWKSYASIFLYSVYLLKMKTTVTISNNKTRKNLFPLDCAYIREKNYLSQIYFGQLGFPGLGNTKTNENQTKSEPEELISEPQDYV